MFLFKVLFLLTLTIYSNAKYIEKNVTLDKRANAVSIAKSVYSAYTAYMSDTDNWFYRNLRNYAKVQKDCSLSSSNCNIQSNEIAGNHGKWFIVHDSKGNEQAQCTVRGLTPGPLDYTLQKTTNRVDYHNTYDDHIIDMNGKLVCGCYDKNNKWNEISDVQHVHIYGYQENTSYKEFRDAFSKLESKIDGTVIDHNNDYGFVMKYNAGNRNLPIRMVFEMYDNNVWSYGNGGQKTYKWTTLKNTCVSRYKKNTSGRIKTTPDDTCGSKNGYSCHTGYCCSKYGYCGKSKDYCGSGCQGKYGKCW